MKITDLNKVLNESKYIVKVKHDKGTVNIKTSASSPEVAKELVMKSEGCPASSIISVKLNESEGHKPISAMPTEELKQIMRDETDKTSKRYMAAKHEILHRRVNAKESVVTKGSEKLVKSKLKLCRIMAGHIENALRGVEETGNATSEDANKIADHLSAIGKILGNLVEI